MLFVEAFLQSSSVIDWQCDAIQSHAARIGRGHFVGESVARACFEWVRDEIGHSGDERLPGRACSASDVLVAGNGWCFAKSHLLAALLRAHKIPTGFCYQRLCYDEDGGAHTLHGLNAVYLPDYGWYRVDPRGNKRGVDAQFDPPREKLAWPIRNEGEIDFPGVYAEPLTGVCEWLEANEFYEQALLTLPDPITLPEPSYSPVQSDEGS